MGHGHLAQAGRMLQPRQMKHAALLLVLALPVAMAGCSPTAAPSEAVTGAPAIAPVGADAFMMRLDALCGQAFAGKMVSTDAADADMASEPLVMRVAECSPTEVRIPFAVGADTSRTWVVTRTSDGLRLKHDHRHEDGTEDELSQYGGDTADAGSETRQEFPADQFSKTLFETKGNPASVTNVWAMEATETVFAYELRRPERFFRVEFDLTKQVAE
jgi:hypothetical protein